MTQENARYKAGGAELADPVCTEPEGSVGDPFIYYNGILRNGNRCPQSFDKPTEAGIYTVYVSYMTDAAYYEGSAEFEILPGWARVARPTAVRRKIVFPEGGSVSQICGADPPFIQIAAACASGYASRAYPGRRIDFP